VEAKTIPASAVGGDFYDFPSQSDDWVAVAIGDVSGKGVPAALFMAKLISDLRFTALKFCSPDEILRAVNAGLADQVRRGMFVTMQYLLMDAAAGSVRAANGGHVPLIWYHRRAGKAEPVELPGGPPLGILPEVAYPMTTLGLEHGDSLLLITDGVLESQNARGEAFGLSRLIQVVEGAGVSGTALLPPILEAVEAFSGGRRQDDLTLVQLRWC
jgi:sigma-B regulation protein RsbU (phosphoserine phosphatase)